MDCVCEGVGCAECGGTGRHVVRGCPFDAVTPSTSEALEMADFWKRGIPPAAPNCFLEQTASAIEAVRIIWQVENKQRAMHGVTRDFE